MSTDRRLIWAAATFTMAVSICGFRDAPAGVLYSDPAGGWAYQYNGGIANPTTSDRAKLDGTWSAGTGQNYDGSEIGGILAAGSNAPGGAAALVEGEVDFLRLQDPGDPRSTISPATQFSDAQGSNRRIKLVRNLGSGAGGLGLGTTLLDTGVTLSFRARLSTAATGVVDDSYPAGTPNPGLNPNEQGGQASATWAPGGNGAVTSTQGNGMFSIRQSDGGGKLISFSLALSTDDDHYGPSGTNLLTSSGLVTNLKTGTTVPPLPNNQNVDVSIGSPVAGATVNVVPISDSSLVNWHEFWITIVGDTSGGGTHKVRVYMDGSFTPTVFDVTAGNGGSGSSFADVLALGDASTAQMWAFDTDFLAIKAGVSSPVIGDIDSDGDVDGADFGAWQNHFPTAEGASLLQGDADGDGDVDGADFIVWQTNYPFTPGASTAPVPEPASLIAAAFAGLFLLKPLNLRFTARTKTA
jgi:hypothetical protein